MQRDPRTYLFDMRQACELIFEFTAGRTLDQYRTDALLRSAVERQFQILGEALNELFSTHPAIARRIPEHRAIINFRHILVHRYDRIDNDTVWGIVETKLPVLRREVDSLLAEYGNGGAASSGGW